MASRRSPTLGKLLVVVYANPKNSRINQMFLMICDITTAVQCLEIEKVRNLLDFRPFDDTVIKETLTHEVVQTHSKFPDESTKRSSLIFMLCNDGFNVDSRCKNGFTPLYYAVQLNDAEVCRCLLQCGADMHRLSDHGVSIMEEVIQSSNVTPEVISVFKEFQPGLWKAVECCDVNSTRRLVNLWCRTDLCKNGKNLKEIAVDSGVEGIIGLILNVEPSMKLAHHILAGDQKGAHELLNSMSQYINFNLRNLNARGAPILYFAIQKQYSTIIKRMREYDCRLYTVMRDEYEEDMPVFFSCLRPSISKDVLDSLLQKDEDEKILCNILYKGKSVIEIAIDNNVQLDGFDTLITAAGPVLLSNRNKIDETPREYAIRLGKTAYADVIDKKIANWICYPKKYPGKRQMLALCGYTDFIECDLQIEEGDGFLHYISKYQQQISKLCTAAEDGDLDAFRNFMIYEGNGSQHYETELFWNGRSPGEGLPILHRAVIWRKYEIVELIFKSKTRDQCIDTLLDQYHRTATHYAFGLKKSSNMISLILDQGCSEHILDKNGKEPIDFKLKKMSQEMDLLFDRLKCKDFKSVEPEPWNIACALEQSPKYAMGFFHSHQPPTSHHHIWNDINENKIQPLSNACIIL
ncbi:hypothetical protein GQR58_009864 [Nymphon striatum]|nr:hypothetical protein GQR58_009864 [Nymphon striatum]